MCRDTLKSLYYTLEYLYFTYCHIVWGNICKLYVSSLIILQKRIIRIVSGNDPRLAHTEPIFKEQEILPFNVLHKYQVAQFIFNFIKGDTSKLFIDMFMYDSNVHHYNTRQSHLLHIPAVSSNLGKMNLRYEGPVIWNELQSSLISTAQCIHSKENWNWDF